MQLCNHTLALHQPAQYSEQCLYEVCKYARTKVYIWFHLSAAELNRIKLMPPK